MFPGGPGWRDYAVPGHSAGHRDVRVAGPGAVVASLDGHVANPGGPCSDVRNVLAIRLRCFAGYFAAMIDRFVLGNPAPFPYDRT